MTTITVTLTPTETMPRHYDWRAGDRVVAHNVPEHDSSGLPSGWEWVDAGVARAPVTIIEAERHDEIQGAIDLTVEVGGIVGSVILVYDEGAHGWAATWADSLDQWLDESLHHVDLDELVALCDAYIERHRSTLVD